MFHMTQSLPVNVLHTMPVMTLSFWQQVSALGLDLETYVLGLSLDLDGQFLTWP